MIKTITFYSSCCLTCKNVSCTACTDIHGACEWTHMLYATWHDINTCLVGVISFILRLVQTKTVNALLFTEPTCLFKQIITCFQTIAQHTKFYFGKMSVNAYTQWLTDRQRTKEHSQVSKVNQYRPELDQFELTWKYCYFQLQLSIHCY